MPTLRVAEPYVAGDGRQVVQVVWSLPHRLLRGAGALTPFDAWWATLGKSRVDTPRPLTVSVVKGSVVLSTGGVAVWKASMS